MRISWPLPPDVDELSLFAAFCPVSRSRCLGCRASSPSSLVGGATPSPDEPSADLLHRKRPRRGARTGTVQAIMMTQPSTLRMCRSDLYMSYEGARGVEEAYTVQIVRSEPLSEAIPLSTIWYNSGRKRPYIRETSSSLSPDGSRVVL